MRELDYEREILGLNARDINITNVTNITNMTSICGHGGQRARRHGRKRREERPPKLLRYSASCGLLDGDLVSKMSNEELCCESVKTLGYAANKFGECVGGIGRDVLGIGQELVNMTCLVGKYLFGG